MSKPSLRVHVAATERGFVGTLLRRYDRFLEDPPSAAYGPDVDSVLAQLELSLLQIEADEVDGLTRYLWTESFAVRRVDIDVHPDTTIGRRRVIGASKTPLRLAFAYCELEGGGFRCALPRFNWWFVIESLSIAAEVIESSVSAALLGIDAAWVFDFRYRGEESVVSWAPDLIARRAGEKTRSTADLAPAVLEQIGEELVAKAVRGRLPRLAGSDPRFDALAPLFARPQLPSILFVGPSGVGKSTFVHRLAHHLLAMRRGKLDGDRRDIKLWSTAADNIIAGMIYLGMWQDRVLEIIAALSHEGDYLRVERLAPLIAAQTDGSSIADLLTPALEAGEISLISEATERELLACRQLNSSFIDQFHIVRLGEPPIAELTRSLEVHVARLEPPLELAPTSMRRAISHLRSFRRDHSFPGKAFQFFEWISREQTPSPLFPRDVSEAFSRYTGLPVEVISDDIPAGPEAIGKKLGKNIIGQHTARMQSARVIARLKAGLDDPSRPVGTLFFVGPTGVGKTELARQIAGYLFGSVERLIRIDMSEYMLGGAAQRLLASGPGNRSLAEYVRRHPLSVVLLDEIEKAHPDVFDLLLGVLGEGRLTDAAGQLVDFRMTVIIMTSNLGARRAAAAGFGDSSATDYLGAVRRHFRPEFFARIDHVIEFDSLTETNVEAIVELELARVAKRVGLERRSIILVATADAKRYLARAGFDAKLGARPLKRLIEDELVAPLSVELAATPELAASRVTVSLSRERSAALEIRFS